MENKFIPRLYNSKQLFIAAIIGGTTMTGSVIGLNLWAQNKKRTATLAVFLGVLFEIILLLISYLIAFHLLNFSDNKIRIFIALLILLVLHGVLAFFTRIHFINRNNVKEIVFPVLDKALYINRKTFPLIFISVICFFVFIVFPPYYWPLFFIYSILHIYGYSIISKNFGNNVLSNYSKAIIVVLACLLPLVFTTDWILRFYMDSRSIISEYLHFGIVIYIVFLLYILISILGLRILHLINKFLKFVSLETIKNKTFVLILIAISIIVASGITIYGFFANNNPIINKYSIVVPQKSSELDNLKVICVADIHLKNTTSNALIVKLTNKIKQSQPDILLLPGDILESWRDIKEEKKEFFQKHFNKINPKYGTYLSLGNHDFVEKPEFYQRMNMTLLNDSLINVENKFYVLGLKYRGNNEKRPIDSILTNKLEKLPVLLLDHAPYCLENAIKNSIDVQFSGHTHNGQIWPFNYITSALFDIDWGYKKIENTHVFVTCGVQDGLLPLHQNASIPIRTGSFSEIIELDIEFK